MICICSITTVNIKIYLNFLIYSQTFNNEDEQKYYSQKQLIKNDHLIHEFHNLLVKVVIIMK
jgi:hypothetical protein